MKYFRIMSVDGRVTLSTEDKLVFIIGLKSCTLWKSYCARGWRWVPWKGSQGLRNAPRRLQREWVMRISNFVASFIRKYLHSSYVFRGVYIFFSPKRNPVFFVEKKFHLPVKCCFRKTLLDVLHVPFLDRGSSRARQSVLVAAQPADRRALKALEFPSRSTRRFLKLVFLDGEKNKINILRPFSSVSRGLNSMNR